VDPEFEANLYIVASTVLLAVVAFFIVPACLFAVGRVKNYFRNLTFEQSFRLGYYFGCGWGVVMFLFFLLISPVTGTVWFVQTIKEIKSTTASSRKLRTKSKDNDDLFNL